MKRRFTYRVVWFPRLSLSEIEGTLNYLTAKGERVVDIDIGPPSIGTAFVVETPVDDPVEIPGEPRVPIMVKPETREHLQKALMTNPKMFGVGYSAFIELALEALDL